MPDLDPAIPRLRSALAVLGLTQVEAAKRLGVKQPTLAAFLTGQCNPTLNWLHATAVTLGIDPSTLDDRLASNKARKRNRKNSLDSV